MGRKFSVLRERMAPEAQARARLRAAEMLDEMPLYELRQARKLSQEALAKLLGARQASISKLEHRTDMYVSTLRSYVEAMGGALDIIARFPDGDVRIGSFGELEGYRYPVAGSGREPMTLQERPVPSASRRRARRAEGTAARRSPGSLEELRALRTPILEIAARHGATDLRLFGSVVRGEMRTDSDVDLLITAGKDVGPWFPGGLAAELGELLGRRVDVVTEQALAPELRERVLQEAVPL